MNRSQAIRGLLDLAIDVHNGQPVIPSALVVGKFTKTQQLLTEACGHLIEIRDLLPAAAPAAPAPAITSTSGAGWAPSPEAADRALAAGARVVSTQSGVLLVGQAPGGESATFALEMDGGRLEIAGPSGRATVTGLTLADLAAVTELIEGALGSARRAFNPAIGRHEQFVGGTATICGTHTLTCAGGGPTGPSISYLGISVRTGALTLMQLAAELRGLLVRQLAGAVGDRASLEALLAGEAAAVVEVGQ